MRRVRKIFQQLLPFGIVADNSDRDRTCAERPQIVNRVSATARNNLCFAMIQNQDRSFSRNTGNLAVNENIGDEIAEDDDALALEPID